MFWETRIDQLENEVVVDCFGMEISSSYWDSYLDNKLDADDDVRIYSTVKRLWEEHAHNLKNLKELRERGIKDGLDYVNYLFHLKGVEMV